MTSHIQHAFVGGTKPRYILHISEAAELAGYAPLHRLEFTSYRAAQNVANAVKAAMAAKKG